MFKRRSPAFGRNVKPLIKRKEPGRSSTSEIVMYRVEKKRARNLAIFEIELNVVYYILTLDRGVFG